MASATTKPCYSWPIWKAPNSCRVGNVARQADTAKQALSVVYQQAVEARDAVSGVSLDEEASALVRYQQAYQANAKVMQTSMTLFESILQVR